MDVFENNSLINVYLYEGKYSNEHTHNFLELAYVLKGSAEHILNGEKRIIKSGDYFIINYGSHHSYKSCQNQDFAVINCLFHPEFIDASLTKCENFDEVVNHYMLKHNQATKNISPSDYIFSDDSGEIYDILCKMIDEFDLKRDGYYEILRCRLIEIIILTMRKNTPPQKAFDEICKYMIDFALKNFEEKNLLSEMSRALNFSPSYLSRKFKENTGVAFSSYLQKLRVEQACRMLIETKLKITEIAQAVGYSDMKYFNSVFKQRIKMPPREFRKNYS